MPRKENALETVIIKVSSTAPVRAYLEALVPCGLYGKTVPEVANSLLTTEIRRLISVGELQKK